MSSSVPRLHHHYPERDACGFHDSVVKQYSPSVRIVHFTIPAGGITALVGPTVRASRLLLTMIGRLDIDEGDRGRYSNVATILVCGAGAHKVHLGCQENHYISAWMSVSWSARRFPHTCESA